MDLGLKDQVVVVVGAARGIGHAIATEFTREAARVAWLDRDPQITEIARRATSADRESCGIVVDVTQADSVGAAADHIVARWGICHHVVMAVGAGSGKFGFPFWNLDPRDWHHVWQVNMMGAVHVAHAFAPAVIQAGFGTFCFLTSVAGQIGSQTDPPYSAAKAALINFAQCAAKDLAPHNIRVNLVAPGMVQTELNRSVWQAWRNQSPDHQLSYEAWGQNKIEHITPLRRWQEPEDIAAIVTFLASSRATNITGQTLNVDGGQVMHS